MHALAQKSGTAERDKLILGARAPSPAMNAQRETGYSFKKFEFKRAAHATAGEGARAPSTNRLVADRINFLGKVIPPRSCDFLV